MLPLPSPYSAEDLEAVPSDVLERLSAFAYGLHVRFSLAIPDPSAVTLLSQAGTSIEDELHLLPGGRWLVGVTSNSWQVTVWDLRDAEGCEVLSVSLPHADVITPISSVTQLSSDALQVLVCGTQLQSSST